MPAINFLFDYCLKIDLGKDCAMAQVLLRVSLQKYLSPGTYK